MILIVLKLVCLCLSKLELNHKQMLARQKKNSFTGYSFDIFPIKAVRQFITSCHFAKRSPSFMKVRHVSISGWG